MIPALGIGYAIMFCGIAFKIIFIDIGYNPLKKFLEGR